MYFFTTNKINIYGYFMKKLIFVIPFLISGCGIQRKIEAQQMADRSLVEYKKCLNSNTQKPSRCEAMRLIYEADKKNNDSALSMGIMGISNSNADARGDSISPVGIEQPRMWMENRGDKSYQCNNIGGSITCN